MDHQTTQSVTNNIADSETLMRSVQESFTNLEGYKEDADADE